MKLRTSIRPPKRLNSEDYESPCAMMNLRRSRKPNDNASAIQFNPNLPPAAFPTLDKPRAPGSHDDNVTNQDACNDKVDFEDITLAEIENLKASNGPLNPIYMRNMNLMATAGYRESHLDFDTEATDDNTIVDCFDQGNSMASDLTANSPTLSPCFQSGTGPTLTTPQPTCLIPDPQWDDLPASIRIEIFSNLLLQTGSWSRACTKLGLSDRDEGRLQKVWTERDEQADKENAKLEEMREKQLCRLMRHDNSLRSRDSASLSRQVQKAQHGTIGRLRENPLSNHFMCSTDQVAVAGIFLQKRGLDPRLVGDWSNGIPVVKGLEREGDGSNDSDDSMPRNISKSNPAPVNMATRDSHSRFIPGGNAITPNQTTRTLSSNVSLMNDIRPTTSISPMDVARHRMRAVNPVSGRVDSQSQRFSQPSRPNRLSQVQLAARRGYIDPAQLVWDSEYPPLDCIYLGLVSTVKAATDSSGESSGPAPASTGSSQPIRRILGGNWSYMSTGSKENPTSTSTGRMRSKVNKTRIGTRKKNRSTNHGSREQQRPAPQPEQDPLSIPPRPTRAQKSPSLVHLDSHASLDHEESPLDSTGTLRAASPSLNEDLRERSAFMSFTPPSLDDQPAVLASEGEVANDKGFEEDEMETGELDEVVLVSFSQC